MGRFLVGTIPAVGHINPIVPVVRELVARGHQVQWYTGEQFRMKVEACGAMWRPMRRTSTFGAQAMDAYPEREAKRGVERVLWDIEHVFIESAAGQADDCAEILADFPADVLLCDTMFLGARFLHERGDGPPWAKFNITILGVADTSGDTPPLGLGLSPGEGVLARARNRGLHWLSNNVLFRRIHERYREARFAYGLPAGTGTLVDDVMSPYLWLQSSVPSFEYPHSSLPPQVHFIGAVLAGSESSFVLPDWWREVETTDRPVLLVTQGTVSTDLDDLIKPVCDALASENLLVVVTTAGRSFEGVVPANVRVAAFLPYDRLLPHVDVVVTNGSYGTVQYALSYGIPMVACGITEDKIEVCARIDWSGAGIRLKGDPPPADQIRAAVERVLMVPSYRSAAERIRNDLREHDAPREAAVLLEELAATKQPVVTPIPPMGAGRSPD
ncbi:MAG: glycosyltransferase [Capsulimonadaceae bacterium]